MTYYAPPAVAVEAPCYSPYEASALTSTGVGPLRSQVVTVQNAPAAPNVSQTSAFPDRAIQGQGRQVWATSNSVATVFRGPSVQIMPTTSDETASMLAEARRLTGWTWERLAVMLGKSRQALHAWTLGGEITGANFERLSKLVVTLRFIDRGTAEQNRSALAKATGDGRIALDLLDAARFDEVRDLLGPGEANRQNVAESSRLFHEMRKDQIARQGHWFERLAREPEVDGLDIVPARGEKRRITMRRG